MMGGLLMTNNDELKADLIDLDLKIDKRFDEVGDHIKALVESYATMVDHLTGKKKPKADIPEPTATNHRGNNTVGPGIIKKRPNAKKLSVNGKIPDSYKIAKKGCKWCDGVVAWPRVFVTDKEVAEEGKVREGPIHCDIDGNIKGDGRCPNL